METLAWIGLCLGLYGGGVGLTAMFHSRYRYRQEVETFAEEKLRESNSVYALNQRDPERAKKYMDHWEEEWRTDKALECAKEGLNAGFFWPLYWFFELIVVISNGCSSAKGGLLGKLSAYASNPVEQERRNAKALEEAYEIVRRHEQDEKDKWTNQFNNPKEARQ